MDYLDLDLTIVEAAEGPLAPLLEHGIRYFREHTGRRPTRIHISPAWAAGLLVELLPDEVERLRGKRARVLEYRGIPIVEDESQRQEITLEG